MRRNPSIAGLRALEAVARCGSVTAAAKLLCVTPAAISHRLSELEAEARTPLLERRGRVIQPTEAGRRVIDTIGDAFERLRLAQEVVHGRPETRPLRVAAPTSLVLGWLIERLADFYLEHPGISIEIAALDDPLTVRPGEADLVVVHGEAAPAADWLRLCDSDFSVVYNARRLRRTLLGPADLADVALIRCDLRDGGLRGAAAWPRFLSSRNVRRLPEATELHASQAYAALRMAEFGQGVALLSRHLTARAIHDGALQEMPDSTWRQGTAIWAAVTAPRPPAEAQARVLAGWLRAALLAVYGPVPGGPGSA